MIKQFLQVPEGYERIAASLARITSTHAEDVCFQVILPCTLDGYRSGESSTKGPKRTGFRSFALLPSTTPVCIPAPFEPFLNKQAVHTVNIFEHGPEGPHKRNGGLKVFFGLGGFCVSNLHIMQGLHCVATQCTPKPCIGFDNLLEPASNP